MTRTKELRLRYEAKKKELEYRLAQARADVESAKNDEIERLQRNLDELKNAVAQSWGDLTENAARTLNQVLDRLEGKKHS